MPDGYRIIPCLDVKDGRVVKGVNFQNLRDVGDPVELATEYERQGADEIVFLDVSASKEGRKTLFDVVTRTAECLFIPLTVGGGVSTVDDIRALLRAGADKVALNTGAVNDPRIITDGARLFGSQCIVVSIDAKSTGPGTWCISIYGGSRLLDLDALEWAREVVERGAGEILLTSMDADGTKAGFDLDLLRTVRGAVSVPVIASGGAGGPEDFLLASREGTADAALAASIFHYGEYTVADLKGFLGGQGITVRETGMKKETRTEGIP